MTSTDFVNHAADLIRVVSGAIVFLICLEHIRQMSRRTVAAIRLATCLLATASAAWVAGEWVWPQCQPTLSAFFMASALAYLAADHHARWTNGPPRDIHYNGERRGRERRTRL